MTNLLIYLFPAAMDLVLSGVLFMTTVWAAQRGASASTVANLITVWAVVYMLTSLAAGRIVTRRNAAALIVGSCVLAAAISVAFMSCDDLSPMYLLVAIEGIAMAAFFTPFQVFMKIVGESRQRSINRSVGLYTLSWSLGFALGPFVAGLLWETIGWRGCHAVSATVALLVAVGACLLKHHAHAVPPVSGASEDEVVLPVKTDEYAGLPDLAWMGWIFSGTGCIAVTVIRGLFPSSGALCDLPKAEMGIVLFILSFTQAIVGLALGRGRYWMYRPLPVLMFGLCGIASLCLFAVANTFFAFTLAAACFGLYSGAFFFFLVFHSLVHPEKSARHVSINEAVVGLTAIIGPLVSGLIADHYRLRTSYLLTGGMIFVAVAVQACLLTRLVRIHAGARGASAPETKTAG